MLSIALSIPFTTDDMFPVTWRMVTAVSTRLATASMRLDSLSKLSDSLFLRMELEAYIRAPSLLPCCNACKFRSSLGHEYQSWRVTEMYLFDFGFLCVFIFLCFLRLTI